MGSWYLRFFIKTDCHTSYNSISATTTTSTNHHRQIRQNMINDFCSATIGQLTQFPYDRYVHRDIKTSAIVAIISKPGVVRPGRNLGSLTFSVTITKIPAIKEIIWKPALNSNGALDTDRIATVREKSSRD